MKRLILLSAILLTACQQWKPVEGRIMTPWGENLNPSSVLQEYPRPSLVRDGWWASLNGEWDYAIVPTDAARPEKWDGKILVPFAPESALSGVGRKVGSENALWYNTSFKTAGGNTLLHFDAVDWSAEVWVNGQKAGQHTGGYTRFSLDITPFLKPSGKQELTVKVLDGTDNDRQPRGKQVSNPEGIWYTAVTGIWQSVWLEKVSPAYVVSYDVVSDIAEGTLAVTVRTEGGDQVEITVDGVCAKAAPGEQAVIKLPTPKLWSPEDPFLYDVDIKLFADGSCVDVVKGYAALREISAVADAAGHKRMAVNGKPLFQFGPLDQGWWPDGLYTAPSDEALKFDIVKTQELGYNMIRKHIKVEPERWYWWCDRLGMLVWQDMPSIADNRNVSWIVNDYSDVSWETTPEVKDIYYKEWGEIIAQLRNHPSIVVWVPFNEAWAQFDTPAAVAFTKKCDPTRLVNPSSGGNFIKGLPDILDHHHYPNPAMVFWDNDLVNVLGEYGGIGCPVQGHLWQADKNWGYIEYPDGEAVLKQYAEYAEGLKDLVGQGCAAAVYTQTTDVEGEVNGLMTYDRKVVKMDPASLSAINRAVIGSM